MDITMNYDEVKRKYLDSKFDRLNVGWVEEIDNLPDDEYEDMIDELWDAQKKGELNLETEQGLTNLQEIVERYL